MEKELTNLLNNLNKIRKQTIQISFNLELAKVSDFIDDADLEIAKAIRNVKQAIKTIKRG